MLFWWIGGEKSPACGGVVVDLCGGGDAVVIESIKNVVAVFVVVVWWLMGGPVGFIGFRDGWCWFLVRINGGFLVVNGSFGGRACGD